LHSTPLIRTHGTWSASVALLFKVFDTPREALVIEVNAVAHRMDFYFIQRVHRPTYSVAIAFVGGAIAVSFQTNNV
jgi:hypothetical protein